MRNQQQKQSHNDNHCSEVEEEHPNVVLIQTELPGQFEREDRVD